MPRFLPFRAIGYSGDVDVTERTAPPYDVFDDVERARLASLAPDNFVLVDYPLESEGSARYANAAATLRAWMRDGRMHKDDLATYSIYRMTFTDEAGRLRTTVGVIGTLEVVDEGAPGVLPHERTTPKAKTDRLDLTRATGANLSPVWGLSLATGLTDLIEPPGRLVHRCTDPDGVEHVLERVDDPDRIAAIRAVVESSPVLIADGHHRYAISRSYRDEMRGTERGSGAETTMTYVQQLEQDQLSVAAIHRLYDLSVADLSAALSPWFASDPAGKVDRSTIAEMESRGALCLVGPDGQGTWLTPLPGVFDRVRALDSARLEHALAATPHEVRYQHGVEHVLAELRSGRAESAVLIRPVSLAEIRRTADTGDLMPPKSTFFTPKLRSGMVVRDVE